MGLFRSSIIFLMGTGYGVYVAQNYNIPDVKKLYNTYSAIALYVEKAYRKPEKKED